MGTYLIARQSGATSVGVPLTPLSGYCLLGLAATQFILATTVAIPAASLCINRRLYRIASVQSVTTTRAQKRRDNMVDLAIGIGLPILVLILRECRRRGLTGIIY